MAEELVEGVDFYREGPYTVFTAHYLQKRGYCCESGCRHCPYGFGPEGLRRRRMGLPLPPLPTPTPDTD